MNDSQKGEKKCLTCILYDLLSTKRLNIKRSRLEFGKILLEAFNLLCTVRKGWIWRVEKRENQTELQLENKLSVLFVKK